MPYSKIEDPTKLRRVLEATLLVQSDLELPEVLRHVVEEARSMTGARYGALGVLDEEKHALSDFITVGLTAEQERAIGPLPTGLGVLGILIADPKPLRIAEIGAHPERLGFPPGHPPMTSFLGVPVKVRDEVYGNLYLTDKIGWSEFTGDDVALVEALSVAAGIAIENARLHERVRRSAVYEDRDRMARDLHDTVIQRLFALGLTLQGIAARLPDGPAGQIGETVHEIDHVITQVRSTIYELGMGGESRGVRDDVTALVRGLSAVVGSEVAAQFLGTGRRPRVGPGARAPAGHHSRGAHQRRQACPGHAGARRRGRAPARLPTDHHRRRGGAGRHVVRRRWRSGPSQPATPGREAPRHPVRRERSRWGYRADLDRADRRVVPRSERTPQPADTEEETPRSWHPDPQVG